MVIDFEGLFQAMAPLVEGAAMEDRRVGETFRRLMSSLMTFDYVVVFAYRGKERPIDLYSTFDAKDHVLFVSLYQAGPYLLDPFYHAACAPKPGVWRMRELAPDRFFSSEYYRTYYVQTGLAEEVGFFVPVSGQATVVLSLMRREATGSFSAAEFALLKKAEALVAALVRHHWADLDRRFDAALARTGRGRRKMAHPPADGVWRHLNLTEREASIIELVLQGHSSESIGLRLGISTGTVKVHRRNVYRKLGISSQTQLLSLYINSLGH
ncbi:DNA-binding CsgD family transcriptional regulator [Sinorhizobium kostiense]|uniref:DNA-binding CsgD family transcriptional regulator n=2 Tax=Sinorhizobium kostiense TaxID=76747 RepID=A0ABS4R4N6_9HYPH|nr:helix-turn-helix transcriptional regulator [Sinorhizobium kostiense]MBP2236837.1 DNA-binding CsgD family transcriptional regulator [Sinorhizobium kostiense]